MRVWGGARVLNRHSLGTFGGQIQGWIFGSHCSNALVLYRVWYYEDASIMSHTIKDKQELILRAKRIQGQIEALVRALTEERDCSDVLQVMSAARGAMNSLMAELLEGHIKSHVLNGKQKPTSQQLMAADEVINMVKSYLK
jgi:DNA-binding FrmR family transcriptional regulator